MSLLNDMLRDLSQQQKHFQENPNENSVVVENISASAAIDQQLFRNSRIVKHTPVIWLPSLLVFIVALILLSIGKQIFFVADKPQNPPIVSEASITAAAKPQLLGGGTDAKSSQSVKAEIDSTITEPQQLQIYDLLQEAARALTMERLTTPARDNAHRYYQQILAIDPQNPAALQGLRKIADRYLAMADEKLQQSDVDHAERLVDRAEAVVPDNSLLNIYREKITQARAQAELIVAENIEQAIVNDDSVATADDELSITENFVAIEEPAENSSEPSVSIQEPFVNANEPQHLSIAPNAKWQDQQSVQQARLLIDNNNLSGAIQVLREAIANSDKPSASTKMLLDIYCQQQLIEEVKTLLDSAGYLAATEQAYYGAKLALLNNEQDTAISLLEAQHTNAEDYEQYRALLASLYHSSARYSEAASHYRRLLNAFGDKPAYWLGFALALDALEQKTSALQAYKRLAEFRDLQSEVRAYIEQRVLELTPN